MDNLFEQTITVGPSLCDAAGLLSYHDAFGVCMDVAATHAQALGCGIYDLSPRGLFWITVKTQLSFFERPRMMERVTLRTWPEAPGKLRGNRSYEMRRGEHLLISGKTEWAVMQMQTKQLVFLSDVYPPELTFLPDSASPAPFARIPDEFDGCAPFASYTVRSTDIDVGGHMNNAAYLRAVFGAFSNEALRGTDIGRVDILFRSSCYEGETLSLRQKALDGGTDLRVGKPDGTTAALLRIAAK